MFTAIVLGAILVFIIDNDYKKAGITALAGAAMAAIGLIHAPNLAFLYSKEYFLAYIIVAVVLFGYSFIKDTDEESKIVDIVAD